MKKYIFVAVVALFSSQAYSQVADDALASKPSHSHKKVIKQAKQPIEVKVALPPPSKASLGFNKAASNANYDMMDLYLQQGADINCLDCEGSNQQATALFRALGFNWYGQYDFKLADWLIQRGADINIPAASGQTTGKTLVMLTAGKEGIPNLSVLDYLVSQGADFKAVDSDGRNALHYISVWNIVGRQNRDDETKKIVAFIDQLVQHGVDVNHQDRSGATALMNAANSASCSPGSIKLLLSYGADPALKDKLGKSALDIAMDHATQSSQDSGCNEVVKILMNPQKVSQSPSVPPMGGANSRPTDNQQSVAIYAGTYGGSFAGDDDGVFQADILQDGTATSSGHSNKYGVTFTATGKVNNNGFVSLGSTSTGAEFSGNISREGALTGTWKNTPQKQAGSFKGDKGVQVTVPPTDTLKVIGSIFGGLFKKSQ